MKQMVLDIPTFGFVVATRAALGAGIGLLISEKLSPARRRAIGTSLAILGAATTVPAVMSVLRGFKRARGEAE